MFEKKESIERECFYCGENKKISILKDLDQKGRLIGVCKGCVKDKGLKIK